MAKTDMSEIVETTEKITEMDNGDGQDYSTICETAASGFSALQSLEGAVGFTLAEPGQSEVMNQLLDVVNENVFDDNSSLEVNLGDNSSRRTSDVSSLSFQNIVLDDPEYDDQRIRSRLDSEDSTDSVHNLSRNYQGLDDDENCHLRAEHDNNLDLDVYKHRIMKLEEFPGTASSVDSKSDSPSDYELIKDAAATESAASVDMRSESDRASFSSREINIVQGLGHGYTPGDDSQVLSQLGIARTYDNGATSTTTASSVDRGGDSDVSDTASSVSNMDGCGRKRNSLEIRNNIPNANEVKLYNDSRNDDAVYYSNTARMKKKSPGLAKRMDYLDVTQNGAHGMNGAYNHLPNFGNYSANVGNNNLSSGLRSRSCSDSGSIRGDWERVKVNGVDIENEYDYVKFARIHQGDAYVGMRLAYSSSNDSLNHHQNSKESLNKNSGFYNSRGSQNSSPEKDAASSIAAEDGVGNTALVLPSNSLSVVMSDDNLTEIPLNCDTTIENGDDNRKFTLSPEATECDSAEVESVISEGGRSSAGMPNVEDGLSSSATSDNEDMGHEPPITPAELLRKRHKADIESNMINPMVNLHQTKNIDSVVSHSHENLNIISRINVHDKISDYSQSLPRNGLSHQQRQDMYVQTRSNDFIAQDVLDLAMQDIKSAIRRSKSMTLKSTSYCNSTETMDHDCDSEPVWVKREISLDDNQQHLLRQEEMRLVREHIEQQEDDHDLKGDECKRKEFEKIDDEDDDDLINRQYIRNDGKKYHPAKGFDSDDDEFEDSHRPPCGQFARHIRSSKHYSKLPNEEANLDNSFSNLNSFVEKSETFLNNDVISSDQKSLNIRNTSLHHDIANSTNNLELKHHISSPSCEKSQYNKQYQKNKCHECSECDCDEATIVKGQEGAGIGEFDTDEETDQLLDKEYRREEKLDIPELSRPPVNRSAQAEKRRTRGKEVAISDPDEPTVLIEGVLFRARYLGSTQLISEGQPSKAMRMMQAQEAVGRIKAPEGDSQPSTEVDLFVSTEKIMVLNTDLQEIMMDHSLRTISYIADIGEIIVIMARRRMITSPGDEMLRRKKQSKIICHVFECEEAQLIAQSIGQAFQVAYMEFLKANGIEDPSLMKEMDYQEVLNQQEIFGEELSLFANRDTQKEVIVPKLKGEPLGVVIVESGWGSMVPTVVLANMSPTGAAARCGQLNIGDQIMSINGVSLVGLSLTSCQTYIKAAKNQTVVKLTVVQCPPVVEVLIKRPDVKYQLGFSVQNGVICSLLRGGIAERGGVRVGHRIIEINGSSVVAVAHEKIVSMLATSVGEIHMKTMPTSIYRLLTGQETPHYI